MLFYLSMLSSDEDEKLFMKIYNSCKDSMSYEAFRKLKSEQKVEDAMQDSICKLIDHFDVIRKLPFVQQRAYFITTCRNKAIDIGKHDARSFPVDDNAVFDRADCSPQMEDQIIDKIDCEVIAEKIAELPIIYRDALCMRLLEGLKTKDIAELLSISQERAKKRVQRGRMMLIDELRKVGF
jgi:RNA polymerase sigma factor, sigma-70 family